MRLTTICHHFLFGRPSGIQTRMRPRLFAALVVLVLVTGGTASAAQPDNLAFVDPAKTQTAVDQASAALTAVLSYDYRKLDDNSQVAQDRGTPDFASKHGDAMDKLRGTATKQKQVVTAKVVAVGVRELHLDAATLVVFFDLTTARGDTNKSSTEGRAAQVGLKLVGGQWRLDVVDDFAS
jgi:Mce-associated membrane protein